MPFTMPNILNDDRRQVIACFVFAGMVHYSEWVPVENPKGKHLFHKWWRERHTDEPPDTVEEILARV